MSAGAPAQTSSQRPGSTSDLTVRGLNVHYGGVVAVRNVDIDVNGGEAVGIIGANGAGKTSTLKAILGLVRRTASTMTFGDVDLATTAPRRVVRHRIGYVPEGRHVFSGLTVEKNLLMGGFTDRWGRSIQPRLERVYETFPVLGEMRRRPAGALSGGQQQMLAIGRAMVSEPQLMVLDEPSMGLSPRLVDDVLATVRSLSASGMSILLVEQNAKLTFEATERCYVMENGRIAATGPSAELKSDPAVRKLYLGI